MKKKLTKAMCLLLALLISFACVACDGGNNDPGKESKRPKGKDIVIYAGGSSEYSWSEGSEEEDVIEYIEQKYYDDTGISLNFKISFLSTDMMQKAESQLAGESQLDLLISHNRGGNGVDDYVMTGEKYYDLSDILEEYGQNILSKISGEPLQSLTTREEEVIGIPSVINPYKYGILVRKDWMEACGYTDQEAKASEEFSQGVNYKLVDNLETFTEMCLAMKQKYKLNHVITGAPWDLEKVLTLGAFGEAGYFSYIYDEEKQLVVPGYTTDYYQQVLSLEYNWVKKGLVASGSNNILLEAGEANFISGSTGVFVLDPTVQHLVQVARNCKTSNPTAEFTVLGPLTETSETTKKGFKKDLQATFSACVLKSSTRAVDIVKFINWMYKDANNYNLCRYGIEGKHWINNGDGTYSYPEGKDSYLVRPPYSGILAFVENQNVSNLTFKGYTEEELSWIEKANTPEYYINNEDMLTYLFPVFSGSVQNNYVSAKAVIYGDLVLKAWTGDTNPTVASYNSFVSTYFSAGGTTYAQNMTNVYNQIKNARNEGE